MRNVEEDPRCSQYEDVNLQVRNIRALRYADDTVLLSRTVEGLGHLVEAVKEHSEAKDLMLNVKKKKSYGHRQMSSENKPTNRWSNVGKCSSF